MTDQVIVNLNCFLLLQLFEILKLQRKQLSPFLHRNFPFDFLDYQKPHASPPLRFRVNLGTKRRHFQKIETRRKPSKRQRSGYLFGFKKNR